MITNDQQLQTTRDRIAWFQDQLAHLRRTETNPVNYRAAASGFAATFPRSSSFSSVASMAVSFPFS